MIDIISVITTIDTIDSVMDPSGKAANGEFEVRRSTVLTSQESILDCDDSSLKITDEDESYQSRRFGSIKREALREYKPNGQFYPLHGKAGRLRLNAMCTLRLFVTWL